LFWYGIWFSKNGINSLYFDSLILGISFLPTAYNVSSSCFLLVSWLWLNLRSCAFIGSEASQCSGCYYQKIGKYTGKHAGADGKHAGADGGYQS
jgi:hypothetical protein